MGYSYFLIFCGQSIWRTVFHNYAVESFSITANELGLLFTLAGVPGLLAFLVGFASHKFRVVRLLTFSFVATGIGLGLLSMATHWLGLAPGVVMIGIAINSFYPVATAMSLYKSQRSSAAHGLGQQKSYGPLASITAALLVLFVLPLTGYHNFLFIAGLLVLGMGSLVLSGLRHENFGDLRGKLCYDRKYLPYYALNFLSGCRSAIFKTFVLFLLVNQHEFQIHSTASLVLAGNALRFISYRLIGRLADSYNRRAILIFMYGGIAVVFGGFGHFDSQRLLMALFLLESFFSTTSVVTDSALKHMQPLVTERYISHVAFGVSLYHAAGICTPIIGALLWEAYGAQGTFYFAGSLALLSVLITARWKGV